MKNLKLKQLTVLFCLKAPSENDSLSSANPSNYGSLFEIQEPLQTGSTQNTSNPLTIEVTEDSSNEIRQISDHIIDSITLAARRARARARRDNATLNPDGISIWNSTRKTL